MKLELNYHIFAVFYASNTLNISVQIVDEDNGEIFTGKVQLKKSTDIEERRDVIIDLATARAITQMVAAKLEGRANVWPC